MTHDESLRQNLTADRAIPAADRVAGIVKRFDEVIFWDFSRRF
jgi:hypothetical protein